MWRDLSRTAQEEVLLPEIIGERCVHSLAEQASCRACVDACPTEAWVINEEMLGIDPDRCDGCDLCVPACPQGAIGRRFAPAIKQSREVTAAFARCERAAVEGNRDGLMPCLHSMGELDLLELSAGGVDYLITSHGDCDDCPRGSAKRLGQRGSELNAALVARGMKPLKLRDLAGQRWIEAVRKTTEADGRRTLSRRAFFRKAVEVPAERLNQALAEESGEYRPPGLLLPQGSGEEPLPFVPTIDGVCCNGCDACVRICPQQAISLEGEEGAPSAYRIEPQRCSGCGLCVDLCEQKAVTLSRWASLSRERIPLRNGRCRSCGATFHVSAEGSLSTQQCRICSRTNHHKNLFQVLD